MTDTFYWHDYETFGTDPSRDRPVQFAGVRTDAELNVIGEPLNIMARPSRDVLPHPEACLVTGITPQQALAGGVSEAEFIAKIHSEMALPGTCSVGYNSIRFDDEVTRYTLYRNFYDPYAREWQNGNSRWDIIDMVRLTHALRPQGINWPVRDDGLPSFRLEELTQANGIGHEAAHDALSDVHATIALARLIRQHQPRLFEHVLATRDKRSAATKLDVQRVKPVLHVSGMFGAARNNIALIAPLAMHPGNKNEIICYDLSVDPSALAQLDSQALRQQLFCPSDQLPAGTVRPGIKTVRLNRAPVLVTPKLLDTQTANRLEIDVALCLQHREQLMQMDTLAAKLQRVFAERDLPRISDPDRMLYSGGFFSTSDKRTIDAVRAADGRRLGDQVFAFEDARLPEMLFRYRARNFPECLSDDETAQWEEFRFQYLTDPEAGASICLDEFQSRIENLLADESLPAKKRALLHQLLEYADGLLA